jgi:molybdopterin-guanine dinucleotide biosynthesis protein
MSVIVVGGHTQGVGKTAVVCAVIHAFPGRRWTAVKITTHTHRAEAIFEETDRCGSTDTSRFLAAGASRALLVRTREPADAGSARFVEQLAQPGTSVLLESNQIVRLVSADLFLFVVRPGFSEWKESARVVVDRADAIVVTGPGSFDPGQTPVFCMDQPDCLPGDLVRFIRNAALPGAPVPGAL